jgi:hypothetical protein
MKLYGSKYSWVGNLKKFSRSRRTGIICHGNATSIGYSEKIMLDGSWSRKARKTNLKREKVSNFHSNQAVQMYFGLSRIKLASYWRVSKAATSRRTLLEMRADVILLRSGLVGSIREARYLIGRGLIERNQQAPLKSKQNIWVSVPSAPAKCFAGELLRIKPDYYYSSLVKILISRVSKDKQVRIVPSHLWTSFKEGTVGIRHLPKSSGSVMLPKGAKVTKGTFIRKQ